MKQVKYIFILLLTLISVRAAALQISAGGSHTMILLDDGTLWACGSNNYGQLGVQDITYTAEPIKVMEGVAQVSAGNNHTMILKTDGTLWACGYNSYGELADGTKNSTVTPIMVMSDVAQVSAGSNYTMIVKKNGSLWGCGYNYNGQVGNGTSGNVLSPEQIMTGVSQVSAGMNHTLIVKTNGNLYACGYNYYGQLGDGTNGYDANKLTPVQITDNVASVAAGGYHSLVLKTDGTLWTCGSNSYNQLCGGSDYKDTSSSNTLVKFKEGVAAISAGYYFSLVVLNDGSLEGYGDNEYAQMGTDYTSSSYYRCLIESSGVVAASAGYYFTVYAKADGSFWACGNNEYGQLGNGLLSRKSTPVKISDGVSLAGAAGNRTFFYKNDKTLWGTGKNGVYCLGDGTYQSKASPVKIAEDDIVQIAGGTYHTFYLTKDGTLWGFGSNGNGRLGIGSYSRSENPYKVMTNVAQVAAGNAHTLILKTDGSLWTCGYNYYGQLGDGTTEAVTTPSKVMDDVAQVAAGNNHSLVLKTDGSLWSCGYNYYGQLGNGTNEKSTTFVKVMDDVSQIAAGYNQSMAIKTDGSLWAFGYNWWWQLGDGTDDNRSTPVKVADDAASVSLGTNHTLMVKKDGTLWAWGYGYYGQLCNDTFSTLVSPTQVMDNVAMAVAGSYHSVIIKKDGTLYTCGNNNDGQLGDGTRKFEPTEIKGISSSVNPDAIEFSANGVNYLLNKDKTATISLITADHVDLDIPSTVAYDGVSYTVTAIGDSIYKGMESHYIYSITFPKTITTIAPNAFDCSGPICTCIFWSSNTALPSNAFDSDTYKEENFMLYVNKEGLAPSSVENVVVNGVADNITLKEEHVFNCRQEFTAKKISFTHEYVMDTGINGECKGYETIALPFDVQTVIHETQGELTPFANFVKDGGKKPFWLYELSSNGWVKASGIKANTPYLISMPNNEKYTPSYNLKGMVTFSSENVTVKRTEESNYSMPVYNGAQFYPMFSFFYTETCYAINSYSKYYTYEGTEPLGSVFVTKYRYVFPFEGLFFKSTSSSAPFRIGDIPFTDGETTGIEQVLYGNSIVGNESDVVRVYTLSGQLISTMKAKDAGKLNLPAGVYVINGKKMIVK